MPKIYEELRNWNNIRKQTKPYFPFEMEAWLALLLLIMMTYFVTPHKFKWGVRSVELLLVSRVFSYKSMKTTETSGARDSLLIQFTLSVIHMIIIHRTTLSESTRTHTHMQGHTYRHTHTEEMFHGWTHLQKWFIKEMNPSTRPRGTTTPGWTGHQSITDPNKIFKLKTIIIYLKLKQK